MQAERPVPDRYYLTVVENSTSNVALFLINLSTCKIDARLVLVVSDNVCQVVQRRVHVPLIITICYIWIINKY